MDGYEIARTMSPETDARLSGPLLVLHERISRILRYPAELVDRGRYGTVVAQFDVSARGQFLGPSCFPSPCSDSWRSSSMTSSAARWSWRPSARRRSFGSRKKEEDPLERYRRDPDW